MTPTPKYPLQTFESDARKTLLAKWREDKPEYGQKYEWARGYTYGGHMGEVLWACNLLTDPNAGLPVGSHGCFAEALYSIMDLGDATLGDGRGINYADFIRVVQLATLAHDLGKAGGEFQYMLHLNEYNYENACAQRGFTDPLNLEQAKLVQADLESCYRYKQAYRHEFLSAILLWHEPTIRDWFRAAAGSDANFRMVLAGAYGHHLKTRLEKAVCDKVFERTKYYEPKPVFLSKLTPTIRVLGKNLSPTLFPNLTDWPSDHPILKNATKLHEALTEVSVQMFKTGRTGTQKETAVSAAIKWLVILSDTFGSIASNRDEPNKETRARLHKVLQEVFTPPSVNYNDRILARFIDPDRETAIARRLWSDELDVISGEEKRSLLNETYNTFQRECAQVPHNLMAIASTGVGKTVGSLAWASLSPCLRLIYATPTTDTATRLHIGYADLEQDSIRHGNAKLELLDTYTDDPLDMAAEQADAQAAMQVLQYRADAGITFCTVDQVLGVCAFYRKSIMWLLYLVQSQVVFDEFHSFDSHMLSWHVKFLRWFPKLRTAHLSATVATALETRIQAALPSNSCAVVRDQLERATNTPRYRMHVVTDPHAHFGPGTLWVCNTVARCQNVGEQYPEATVYHSRFRSMDRWAIRDSVVQMFDRNSDRTGQVISTQVCEMSLDISARCLITEACPPSALIQRMGRANRYLDAPGGVADIYVYLPPEEEMTSGLPYVTATNWQDTYAGYLQFVRQLEGRDISQADLEVAFQEYCTKNAPKQDNTPEQNTDMLHTGRHSVRQGSVTTPCILRSDYDKHHQDRDWKKIANKLSFPAILNRQQRTMMTSPENITHYKFIMDDLSGNNGYYDTQLGWCANNAHRSL